eukprot:CAMPEP_0179065582 /NCGR_PEP_ID=MMETSP0796-20121207/28537_1 /TAXON_ID=73915 /ORGANISM="Pyrodinium bahamense, Strain pbaha01" /LENGTH=152 /DNA_ID=CAMNT_0020762563 /DNA_START=165 /DNA_END=623 /DNA_ORIENTATION=-
MICGSIDWVENTLALDSAQLQGQRHSSSAGLASYPAGQRTSPAATWPNFFKVASQALPPDSTNPTQTAINKFLERCIEEPVDAPLAGWDAVTGPVSWHEALGTLDPSSPIGVVALSDTDIVFGVVPAVPEACLNVSAELSPKWQQEKIFSRL